MKHSKAAKDGSEVRISLVLSLKIFNFLLSFQMDTPRALFADVSIQTESPDSFRNVAARELCQLDFHEELHDREESLRGSAELAEMNFDDIGLIGVEHFEDFPVETAPVILEIARTSRCRAPQVRPTKKSEARRMFIRAQSEDRKVRLVPKVYKF